MSVDSNGGREQDWQERCFAAERELERATDALDSANERIAQLERQRENYRELREDGLTGRTYWSA